MTSQHGDHPRNTIELDHGWIKAGGLMMALAVVLVIFGGPALGSANGPALESMSRAIECQCVHGIAMIATGILISLRPRRMLVIAQWCFLAGTISHSALTLASLVTGQHWLETIAMASGIVLVLGWLALVEGSCPACRR